MSHQASVLFIDNRVLDLATLLSGLDAGVEVVVIDAGADGLQQIAQTLAGRSDVAAIHIVSHGAAGAVQLGNLTLNSENVQAHGAELAAIGDALGADADIVLYGCGTGAGPAGAALVQSLAQLTGADVAASSDVTGAASLGGNWALEVQVGQIEAALPFSTEALRDFDGLLATGTPMEPSATGQLDSNVGIALLTNGGHADLYLHQLSGDNSFNGAPPQYAAKVVLSNGANQIVQTLTVTGTAFVENAAIAKLAGGGFVVAWSSDANEGVYPYNYSAYYQVYDNNGVAQGSVQALTSANATPIAQKVSLTSLADGGFAASFVGPNSALGLAIYDENGSGGFVRTNENFVGGSPGPSFTNGTDTNTKLFISASTLGAPTAVELSDGSIVVTSATYVYFGPNYTPLGDYAYKFDSNGDPAAFASGYTTQRLNWSMIGSSDAGQKAIALKDGGFAVVTMDSYGANETYQLMVFDNDGRPVDMTATITQNVRAPANDGTTVAKTFFAKKIADGIDNSNGMGGASTFSLMQGSDGNIVIATIKPDFSGLMIHT